MGGLETKVDDLETKVDDLKTKVDGLQRQGGSMFEKYLRDEVTR